RLARLVQIAAILFAVVTLLDWLIGGSLLGALWALSFGCLLLLGSAWIFRLVWRRFFWSVGRRLAFSYLLLGLLPIALMTVLALFAAYLLGGFLLGHLYRDSVESLRHRLESAAAERLLVAPGRDDGPSAPADGPLRFAEYHRGRRIGGGAEAPALWPDWLEEASEHSADDEAERRRPFVALADGTISVAAAARDGDRGVVVWYDEDVARWLRERGRFWAQLYRSDDPRDLQTTRIQFGERALVLRGLWVRRTDEERAEFYRVSPPGADPPGFWDRPVLLWMARSPRLRALVDGGEVADSVSISLAGSPRSLARSLLSESEEADSSAWLALAGFGVLMLEIYAAAAALAVFMIYGLSRAVNRLSRATETIARGDFSVRIPVKRKDQLGALQASFNGMAEHLQELVATAVQKEALDKELALARKVQQDLLPREIAPRPELEISTHFEPSAAIGGDYYDVLPRGATGVAFVVADVAGHGLAAGLRMAMVKSALALMVEDGQAPEEIFARLHRMIRVGAGERGFVTATLALFDPATGELELANAGHPPSYLVRADGEVEEILLPGPPLGGLPGPPGRGARHVEPGDALVWLSDGLIEARSPRGDLFGYERVRENLGGPPSSAVVVRDRLLAAVRAHTGGAAAEDDRTLVVMLYRGGGSSPRNA
ncbi:MAG: SpoIIE family protein phosphatase, partial [Acidobacteria bacterium]|nr:SpoIIE family protein phosphatase [Acidobacteriota bacterium]